MAFNLLLRFVRYTSVIQVLQFAIVLLLSASTVLSGDPLCDQLQKTLLDAKWWTDNSTEKLTFGSASVAIQPKNFEHTVPMQMSFTTKVDVPRHIYSVYTNRENHPRIHIDRNFFKLHTVAVSIVNSTEGKAVLAVNFLREKKIETTDVIFLVPLLKVNEGDRNRNADLSSSLEILNSEPNWGLKKNSVKWLKHLLTDVKTLSWKATYLKVFMTDCQNIEMDTLISAFKPKK